MRNLHQTLAGQVHIAGSSGSQPSQTEKRIVVGLRCWNVWSLHASDVKTMRINKAYLKMVMQQDKRADGFHSLDQIVVVCEDTCRVDLLGGIVYVSHIVMGTHGDMVSQPRDQVMSFRIMVSQTPAHGIHVLGFRTCTFV